MDEIQKHPFREGELPPEGDYVLVRIRNTDGSDGGIWWVKASELTPGPIRHENVDELRPIILWTWRHLREYLTWCRAQEDWELAFMRDQNPAGEVAFWVRFAFAYLEFMHRHPDADPTAVFAAINNIANQRSDLVMPKSVVPEFERLLSNPPDLLTDIENFTPDGRLNNAPQHLQ